MGIQSREGVLDTRLVTRLRSEIVGMISEKDLPVGHRITERSLAAELRVSRTPVRHALQQLHDEGLIGRTETGRYFVASPGKEFERMPAADDEDYLAIAADHLDGKLSGKVSEAFLAREYGLTRMQVAQLLTRMSTEGWASPRPGSGWEFLPVLTSTESYEASYRFRLLVEPAGILEPTFVLNRESLLRRRAEQQELVDGRISEVSPVQLFELNSAFHEAVALCSNNDFFIESLTRINRLRRLIEYRKSLVSARATVRCAEHVQLADLLLDGAREEASEFLFTHLATVGEEKTRPASSSKVLSQPYTAT